MIVLARCSLALASLATLSALGSAAAGAQDPRLVQRLPEATRAVVETVLDSARSAGLPTEPLVDRALEGAAKGAGGSLIVSAVRRLWAELRTARAALGVAASPAELTAGASALRAGAQPADLETLRQRRPGQALTVAVAVLADLVAVGVPADSAVAAVLALAAEAGDGTYIAFRRNVENDIALGASPSAALAVRLRAAAEMADATTGLGQSSAPRKRKP